MIYAGNEPKSVLARDLGDCRDNYEKLAERVSHSFSELELQNSSLICTGNHLCVAFQIACRYLWFSRSPCSFSACQLFVRYDNLQLVLRNIDTDQITFLNECDRTALCCLRAYMTDGRTAGCAGKTAVRDQGYGEPSPIPAMAEVGFSISRIPGPPFGPS